LRRRWVPLLVTVLIFFGALQLFGLLGGGFIPFIDASKLQVSLEFPAGTSLERTYTVANGLADRLRQEPEVTGVLVKAGGESRSIEEADIFVAMVDKSERAAGLKEIMNRIRPMLAEISDAKVNVYPLGAAGAVEPDLQIEVIGTDPDAVNATGKAVYEIVGQVDGLVEVHTSDKAGKPEIKVTPKRRHLAEYGLMTSTVGGILRTAYEGEEAGVYREGGEEYDVVVKFAEDSRQDQTYLYDLPVATAAGATVPLGEVVELEEGIGDPTILHSEKLRLVEVTANLSTASLSGAVADIDELLADLEIPEGVKVKYGGDVEDQAESFASIFEALILAVILIYIVLAGILESFIHPLTVMITLPLSLIGMAVSLFLLGGEINIMSLMALVMMVGIVVNNAILMLDYVGQLRGRGLGIREALLEGCPVKLRAIIMSNLAIAVGMVPQLVLGGSGSEFREPMAVVQIGGVLISAIFTLFVIPVVYTLLDRLTLAGRKERLS
jgi:HAE1 family hydrophobic/amphiphilic exporter-1